MKDLADHFDREAASYPTHIGTDYIQRRKWALVEAHARKRGIVADVGAATGRHALELARQPLTVVAVDPSERMLHELARQSRTRDVLGTVHACAAALPDLPFSKNSFDLIYCYSTLLLLAPSAQADAIKTMARALRPQGTLVVDIAGARSLAIRYWHRYYKRRGLGGVYGQTAREARLLIEACGLEISHQEPHGVLSQFLLCPGLDRVPGLLRRVRGSETRPGWDACISKSLPGLAERWYIVAHLPGQKAD